MKLFFRLFLPGLLLLAACTGGLLVKQKSTPYYFSYKKNAPQKQTEPAAPPSPKAVAAGPALQAAAQPAETKAPEPTLQPTPRRALPLLPEKVKAGKETLVFERFAEVKKVNNTVVSKAARPAAAHADGWLLAGAGFFLLAVTGLFTLLRPQAQNIAHWAKQNKKKSWVLLGVLHTLLGFQASFIGRVLHELGFQSSATATYLLLAASAACLLAYPGNKANMATDKKRLFRNRRLVMLALLVSTYFGFISLGNRNAADPATSPISTKIEQLSQTDEALVSAAAAPIAALGQPGTPTVVDVQAVLLILLVVLAAIFLLYLIAVSSCLLMCSGAGALALVVLLGGTALVIWGGIATIREIIRGAKRRKGITPDTPLTQPAEPAPPRDPNAPRPRKHKIDWF